MIGSSYYQVIPSPVGELLITADDVGITGLYPRSHRRFEVDGWPPPSEERDRFVEVTQQLQQYFSGERRHFEVKLSLVGTPFQQRVWQQLTQIPYGTTLSYGEMARHIGNPRGSRAVGSANGKNPISILVPCHRAVGGNGQLTGYAGGLDMKRQLLDLEAQIASRG